MSTTQPDEFIDARLLAQAAKRVTTALGTLPETAVILGSGLGPFADSIDIESEIDTAQIPGYPVSTVDGHRGAWLKGKFDGVPLLAVQGRVHAYEGHKHATVAFPVHLMARLGVKSLIITNAAGGINRYFRPGDLMLIEDQINLTFDNPLRGTNPVDAGARFPDMSEPFSRDLMKLAEEVAAAQELRLHRGVYLGVAGPSYETAAEIRMGAVFGADAVGMSTVPEVIAAVYQGIRVLGISCITNLSTGLSEERLSHADVKVVANRIRDRFSRLVGTLLHRIHDPDAK